MKVWWLWTHCHPDWGSTRAGMVTRDNNVILTEGQHMQVWWLGTHCHPDWGSTRAGMVTRDILSPWLRVNTCRYGNKGQQCHPNWVSTHEGMVTRDNNVILTEGQHMQVWWQGTKMSFWLRVNTCRYGDIELCHVQVIFYNHIINYMFY